MNQADTTLASVSPTHSRLIPYMIIGLMMVCVAAVFVRLGQQLAPTWDNQYLLAVSVCIALESAFIHSQHATRRPSFPMPWLAYRTTEWVIIVVALKFVIQSLHGTHPIWQGLAQWFPEFLGSAFDDELLAVILLTVVIWGLSAQLSSSLADLAYHEPDSAHERQLADEGISRTNVRQHVMDLILMVGITLIFLTALLRHGLKPDAVPATGFLPPPADIYNLIAFFLLGLLLLSRARLALMRATWSSEHTVVSRNMANRWAGFTVLFLLMLALVASLLPTQDSIGLLAALGYLINTVLFILNAILVIIAIILTAIFNFFAGLFGQPPQLPPALPRTPTPQLPAVPTSAVPLSNMLQTLIFWIVILTLVGYSLYQYLHRHPSVLITLQRIPVWSWLTHAWQRFKEQFAGLRLRLTTALQTGRRGPREVLDRASSLTARRLAHLRRWSPRERVMFFYLAMMRRGSETGITRRTSQTPYEYSAALQASHPEVAHDIAVLTDEFVEARYSRHDVTPEAANFVQRTWQRIKHTLRRSAIRKP